MDMKILGLSEYEGLALNAMIKLGKSGASQISRESGVPYGKIYEVLASLERKGLAKTVPEKTKMFVAENPASLVNFVNAKEKELESLKEHLMKMKQIYETHRKEVVHMVKGRRNFYKIIRDMEQPKKFKYTIKYTSEFHPQWARDDRKLTRKDIDVKSLSRVDKETEYSIRKWLKVHEKIKKIENRGVALDIRESEVVIALINNNTILSIRDNAFVNMMKTLFLNTYKNAEEIKL